MRCSKKVTPLVSLLILLVAALFFRFSTDSFQPPALHDSQLDIARRKIIFNPNHPCENQTAVLRAFIGATTRLAGDASMDMFSDSGRATTQYYIGPDSDNFDYRMAGNFKRVAGLLDSSNNELIHVSCKEQDHLRPNRKEGKTVGGSAFSTTLGGVTYHEITLSPAFFTTPALDTLVTDFKKDMISRGLSQTKRERDATWILTQDSIMLHELLHLYLGGNEPHITDERVGNLASDQYAYGAEMVYKLANNPEEGGASRASTNADSYAVLASALQ